MRKSPIQLYAPFIALAMLQALFIVAAPSKGSDGSSVSALGPLDANGQPQQLGGTVDPETGQVIDPATGQVIDPATGQAVDGGAAGGGGPAAGGGATGGGTGGAAAGAGDTSHCKGDRQTDVIYGAPPCAAKFTGDNPTSR
jgi:hypothetical protein